jgi:hypothetical protein
MTFLNQAQSLINLTAAMEKKKKFSYINVPKSAIIALGKNSDNSFPSHFAKNVVASLKNTDPNVMKATSHSLVSDIEDGKHFKIGLHKNGEYYYSNIFEYYYMNSKEIYNSTVNYYIKNTPSVVITFHDKKIIQKHFGNNAHIINVAYTNYYEKIDNIYAQLAEFEGGVDYCIMDCGVLGLALMSKIWDNLNMSTIDFGKTLSLSKVTYPQPVA